MNSSSHPYTTLNNSVTSNALDPTTTKQFLIDVRSPQEFAVEHIPGSLNVPLQMIFAVANSSIQPQDNLVVYCASGMRAAQAVQLLESMGYRNTVNVGTLAAASNYISS